FFFFQAEDGIRDGHVTGVQTCALPIFPNPLEVTMAKLICSAVPSVQKVRMCNSGTEATMSAIRLARGFTRRDKIIKFEGCYHGRSEERRVGKEVRCGIARK